MKQTNKLKIVHLISSFQSGGLEHFVVRLAHHQQQEGYDVSIMSTYGGPLLAIAQENLINTYLVQSESKIERFYKSIIFFCTMRPDIIHAHNPTILQFAAIGKILTFAKLIMTDHAQTRGLVRIPSKLERILVDEVVAVSSHTAKLTHRLGFKSQIKVIYNGVKFSPPIVDRYRVRKKLGADHYPIVINVGALLSVKAQENLIHAISILREQKYKVKLLIVGDGPNRPILKRLCNELTLSDEWVNLLGYRKDIPDLLNASDIFALVSQDEGLPISVLEAMSHGLPVITTPAGGIDELISNNINGIIVPFNDPQKTAEAIKKLIDDQKLCNAYGKKGKDLVAEFFSFDKMAHQYMDLYIKMLKR